MSRLIVIGGGWAGCSAALAAAKKGLAVTLIERTDRLLGSGLVGGIMRNNGRFTAAEELKLMGAGEFVDLTD
ncbi:MAG TPA: FAD-dependent oxidoreductase, partial [Firmicutes bacterium]|nr:FAD-dependent oxidoreductase [Bacillota bacterium]